MYLFGYKHCYYCTNVKELNLFVKNNNTWDKLQSKCKKCEKRYSENNKEKIVEYSKKYNQEHKKEKAEYDKKYRKEHRNQYNAHSAKYTASKLNATPMWLTKKQEKEMLVFYTKAKKLELETNIEYHVDHIIPLQGANVCGLHVPWNLQVITAEENLKKGNKYL